MLPESTGDYLSDSWAFCVIFYDTAAFAKVSVPTRLVSEQVEVPVRRKRSQYNIYTS